MPPCDPSLQPRDFSFRTTSKNAVANVGTGPMLPRQHAVSRRYIAHWTPGFFGIKRSATRNPGSPCSQVARSTRLRSSEVRPEAELTDRAGKWVNWVQWQVYSWEEEEELSENTLPKWKRGQSSLLAKIDSCSQLLDWTCKRYFLCWLLQVCNATKFTAAQTKLRASGCHHLLPGPNGVHLHLCVRLLGTILVALLLRSRRIFMIGCLTLFSTPYRKHPNIKRLL